MPTPPTLPGNLTPSTVPTQIAQPDLELSAAGATLTGTAGPDTLTGGAGPDLIDGNIGADLLNGGGGDDTIQWDPGDGSDTVNGGSGFDTLRFNGSNIGEKVGLSAAGDHLLLTRDVAAISMDIDHVERVVFNAIGGGDTLTIGSLRGTDVRQVDVDLAAIGGGGDSQTDTIVFDGLAGGTTADKITLSAVGAVVSATGLGLTLNISHGEAADALNLDTGGGNDTLDASGLSSDMTVNFSGGDGADVLALNGGAAGDQIFISGRGPSGNTVDFVINGAAGHVGVQNVETVAIDGGAGDDEIVGQNGLSPINLTVDGGRGQDTVGGGDGADTLSGGSGNDLLDGNRGNDVLLGDGGDDTLQWDPGDGSDTVNGGSGFDTLAFNGSNIGEKISLAAAGDHVLLTRDVASIAMDLDNVERVAFKALGGADTFTIGDLRGTDVRQVDIDLAATGGGGDSVADTVIFDGLAGGASADRISFSTVDGATSANGLGTGLSISHAEGIDRLALNTGGGDDTVDATGLAGGIGVDVDGGDGADALVIKGGADGDIIDVFSGGAPTVDGKPLGFSLNGAIGHVSLLNVETVSINGGAGDDHITGSNGLSPIDLTVDGGTGQDTVSGGDGADTLSGGSGNDFLDGNRGADVLLGGAGDDTIQWDPGDGSDTVDGGSGFDTLAFNGSNIGEIIELLADGKHASVTRNVAGVTMDLEDIERLSLRTLGGEDVIYLGDLSGTGLRQVGIDLSGTLGGGDASSDAVQIIGGIGRDKVAVTSDAGGIHVRGLSTDLNLTGAETADRLTVSTFDGADTFDFTGFGGGVALAVNGGADNDRFQFGPGAHANVQIMDFQSHAPGSSAGDLIALKGFVDASFQLAVANNHIAQSGADVVISDAGGVIATLQNVSLASLHANDFLFG